MNTTAKGNKFEDKIYQIFKGLLEDEKLPVNRKQSVIKKKEKYYSEARKKHIITDISIETTMEISSSYNILTIIECKDCNRPTSVDDVEEFYTKISQLKAQKGIVISRHGFQQGAIQVAEHYHIGLIRINDDDSMLTIANRKFKSYSVIGAKTLLATPNIPEGQVVILDSGICYNSFLELFERIGLIFQKTQNSVVPYRSPEEIMKFINELDINHCYDNGCLNIEKICQHIASKYKILFEDQLLDLRTFGRTDFQNNLIVFNSRLKQDEHRYRFTIAHEIGHLLLHRKLHSNFEETESSQNIIYKEKLSNNDIMEYQANIFAEHLLLPLRNLRMAFAQFMVQENITKVPLYLDNQRCNIALGYKACSYIGDKFNVSKQMAKIALKHNNLLKDASDVIDYLRNIKFTSTGEY